MDSNTLDTLIFFVMKVIFWLLFITGLVLFFTRKKSNAPNTSNKPKTLSNPRQDANVDILAHLFNYIVRNPDQRFGQILRNTGVVVDVGVRDSAQAEWETPDYYWARGVHEEPMATLARMESVKKEEKNVV